MRYRKKPIEIEAHQWFKNGDHPEDKVGEEMRNLMTGEKWERLEGKVVRFFRNLDKPDTWPCDKCNHLYHVHGWIDTLEGGHIVCPGDFIITGVEGEMYPCKPSVFHATHELVI